jgi:putative DNA methylase
VPAASFLGIRSSPSLSKGIPSAVPTFIETQFPIARLSAESYKERKAVSGQTLTGLGKWWGRKPLILVRAAIIGMLMPASNNPKRDRETFLKVLTMDDDGIWARNTGKIRDRTVFDALTYAERLSYSLRPEEVPGPSPAAWREINSHLGTSANSLGELIEQLGHRLLGHTPRVGDCFCGGGSIPFEAARLGCEAFGSDLNPVAGLLTWASLNLLGGGKSVQDEALKAQRDAFNAADAQVTQWKIEHNFDGERADAYLYCAEVKPEGCEYFIPLAPTWVVAPKTNVVVKWRREIGSDKLTPDVVSVLTPEFKTFDVDKKGATVVDSRIIDPLDPSRTWSVEALRGPAGLRRWTNEDLVPRLGDVFQERLYCIRWINADGKRRYAAPDADDLAREDTVLKLLRERFETWQRKGLIPSKAIVSGYNTDQPMRERGWTHWHHLFTPRQLLVHGLIAESVSARCHSKESTAFCLLTIARLANWNSRLCQWLQPQGGGIGGGAATFANQALNTLFNFSVRPVLSLRSALPAIRNSHAPLSRGVVRVLDARDLDETCDIWLTDPPYADAVNYHELGDFFLAWYDKQLVEHFPEWTADARAELAVRGDGEDFRRSMVDIYKNLATHMPHNGMQMVMFTHRDPAVWADLGMILWAAGLYATAAWTITTETSIGGMKKGNYVSGTVCLVLRKRASSQPCFLDEVFPLVEDEVKHQIESMQALDEDGEPNFNDADYQLAAYAAALKVLTQYDTLDGKDVEHEVFAVRNKNEKSDFQVVIERALAIACDTLIPRGLDQLWRELSLVERYYLRALDIESRGERRKGMYEELARGFGVTDIRPLLKSDKANGARMFTPSGLASSLLAPVHGVETTAPPLRGHRSRARTGGSHPFSASPLRHLMFAVRETTAADNSPEPGRQYLRDTFGSTYWGRRERFVSLLEWFSALGNAEGMNEWIADSESARILAGRLRNDQA